MLTALRSRDFRLLWLGQSVSMIGDALVVVAVGLFVTDLTGSPRDVGLVLTAYALPVVIFLLIGGVVADRLPRQAVMIGSDVVRAVLHGTLAVLIATDLVQIWHMVVIGGVFGAAEAFFRPAYTGLLPATVAESDIQAAQALTGVSRELSQFAGPALATLLVLGVDGAVAFGLDAATFVVSALLLLRVRARPRGESTPAESMLSELRQGWTAFVEHAWVWVTVLTFTVAVFCALAPFFVLGPSVARELYGSEGVFGYANAVWGSGTVLGVLAGSRWRPRRPMLAATVFAVPWSGAIAVYGSGAPLAVVFGCLGLSGVGIGLFNVWWETALAQRIPPHLLSRVSAWDWLGSLALLPLGYVVAGPVAEQLGAQEVLVGGGMIGMIAAVLAIAPRSTRALRRLEDTPVAEPATA